MAWTNTILHPPFFQTFRLPFYFLFYFFISNSDLSHLLSVGIDGYCSFWSHSAESLWTRDRPVAETFIWQPNILSRFRLTLHDGIGNHHPNKRAAADRRLRQRRPLGSGYSDAHGVEFFWSWNSTNTEKIRFCTLHKMWIFTAWERRMGFLYVWYTQISLLSW
jgi:hypothetical protein